MKPCRGLVSLSRALVCLTPLSQACEAPEPAHPVALVASAPSVVISPPAGASVKISFTYREPASVFEILENTSNWMEGKCDIEYRDEWKKRFGLTADDEKHFAAYQDIRNRYYTSRPRPDFSEDLFGAPSPPDRLAEAFYAASTLDDAFKTLATFMTPVDVATLKAFYETYRSRYEVLVAEGRPYVEWANAMEKRLAGENVQAFYRQANAFYGIHDVSTFTAMYVWWPPVEYTRANAHGKFVLLKYNAAKHADSALEAVDIPVHELMHYLSGQQPEAQRRALTKSYLAGCNPLGSIDPELLLEEPLAVAQQKVFAAEAAPERLDFGGSWYGDPWVGALAKLIYPQVKAAYEHGEPISEKLVHKLSKQCHQLKDIGGIFVKAQKAEQERAAHPAGK